VADHGVIGKTGRVTGTVAPETVGEVMVDHEPPRTVYVSRLTA
jgi:hypothetical protein